MTKQKERDAYTPAPGSVAERVIEHLKRHEADELCRADIADIFSCEERLVGSMLAQAVHRGPLERVRNHEDVDVWRLRRRAHFWTRPPKATEAAAAGTRRRKPVTADIAQGIQIESDVPLYERPTATGELVPWLDKLKPKQSFRLPAEARGVVSAAQSIVRQARPQVRFAIRQISKAEIGIWRVA